MTHSSFFKPLVLCCAMPFMSATVQAAPLYNAVYGDNLVILDQGWDDEERDRFYHLRLVPDTGTGRQHRVIP